MSAKPGLSRRRSFPWSGLFIGSAGAAILLGSYLFVCHSHYYHSILPSLCLPLLLGGWSILTATWIGLKRSWRNGGKGLLGTGLFGGLIILLAHLQTQFLGQQLRLHGVTGYARVVDFEVEQQKGPPIHYVVFEYRQKQQVYRQRIINSDNLRIGDSLRLRYSASDPENVKVNGLHRMGTSYGLPLHGQYEEIQ